MHEQHRKHGPGPRAGYLKRLPAGRHLEGTKDTELHYASFHASLARGKQQRKLPAAAPQIIEAHSDRKRGRTGTEGPAAARTGPDAAEVYALGSNPDESARLQRQSDEPRPEGAALLERLALMPGQSAIDLGCGPRGIIDLLSAAVSPGGRVVGLDANPEHVAMAGEYARKSGLANVEVVVADARHTGLPSDSFDLVHARTLLITIPEPAAVVHEMVRLAKPGSWVACAIRRSRPGTGSARSSRPASAGRAPISSSAAG